MFLRLPGLLTGVRAPGKAAPYAAELMFQGRHGSTFPDLSSFHFRMLKGENYYYYYIYSQHM